MDFGEAAIGVRKGRAAESVEGGVTFGGNIGAGPRGGRRFVFYENRW